MNVAEAIARGWSVIPTTATKQPMVITWKPYQTRRPTAEEIAGWSQKSPASWAVITGAISGIITLDFDGAAGAATIQSLNLKPHRKTPSGGFHVDFKHPGFHVRTLNSKTKRELGEKFPGLDIRADGGYACFTGRTDKGQYTWLNESEPYPLDLLPHDLVQYLGLVKPPPATNGVVMPKHHRPDGRVDSDLLIGRALERVRSEGRNNSGFWLATQLRDNGYSQTEAENIMRNYASRCPDTNTKGQHEPYGNNEIMATVREVFSRSARDPWTSRNDHPAIEHPQQATRGKPPSPEVLNVADILALKTPEPKLLIETLLPIPGAILLAGAAKSGKTVLAVQAALAVASGRPLFDYYRVLEPGPTLLVEQDDPAGAASVKTILQKSAEPVAGIPFNLIERSPFSFGLKLIDWLEQHITTHKLRLVVLDSYTALRSSRGAGVDIVKAEQMDMTMLDQLAKRTNCTIIVVHHASKGSAAMGWSERAAGTYAMSAATEAQIHVSRFPELDSSAPERLVQVRGRHLEGSELVLRFRKDTLDYEHVLDGGAASVYPLVQQIQTAFGTQPFSPKDFCQHTGASRATAHRHIDRLYRANVLSKRGLGEYVLSAKLA
jgi:hypothetical protein